MSQLKKMYEAIFQQLIMEDPHLINWTTFDELERKVNTFFEKAWKIRQRRIFSSNSSFSVMELFDYKFWTDKIEFLDQPKFPVEKKQKIVSALHKFNKLVRSYPKFINAIKPIIEIINRTEKRKARILELASGSGMFAMEIAKLIQKKNLQVEITGSDYITEYVEQARSKSQQLGIPVKFKIINALNLDIIKQDEYDLIFIAQSLHHFSPGVLARIIAGAVKVSKWGFLGIDGFRSFITALIVAGPGLLKTIISKDYSYFHDTLITCRRFYSQSQLEIISKIAVPDARIIIEHLTGHTKIHVY